MQLLICGVNCWIIQIVIVNRKFYESALPITQDIVF